MPEGTKRGTEGRREEQRGEEGQRDEEGQRTVLGLFGPLVGPLGLLGFSKR